LSVHHALDKNSYLNKACGKIYDDVAYTPPPQTPAFKIVGQRRLRERIISLMFDKLLRKHARKVNDDIISEINLGILK
jgi:hypothetical protein